MNTTTNEINSTASASINMLTPKLTMCHPNGRGTGTAIMFELHPAHAMRDGYITCRISSQDDNFDWNKALSCNLNFADVCEIIAVLNHVKDDTHDYVRRTRITPNDKFRMDFYRDMDRDNRFILLFTYDNSLDNVHTSKYFRFSCAEAEGIRITFESVLKNIAFGTDSELHSIDVAKDEVIAYSTSASDENTDIPEDDETAIPANALNDAIDNNAPQPALNISVPSESDYQVAFKTILNKVGNEYHETLMNSFESIKAGEPVSSDQVSLATEILGEDNPVVNYAEFVSNMDKAKELIVAYYGEIYRERITNEFRKFAVNPKSVTTDDFNLGIAALKAMKCHDDFCKYFIDKYYQQS